MIHELQPRDYNLVRPLFRPLEDLPFCAAALEGCQPGRVFVDDPAAPRTAFLLVRDAWGYLAGAPSNDAFNQALNRGLFAREIVPEGVPLLQLTCDPEDWHRQLAIICHPRQPIAEPRRNYAGREAQYDWRTRVPAGMAVQPIDEMLLAQPDLPDDVSNLARARQAATAPDGVGFGYVVLHAGRVVSYAMVDCIVGEAGEIFLFTAEDHRQRGLATIASAATVEYGLAHGLARIQWDCQLENLGSLRTAERLGFTRNRDYTMHYFFF